MLLSDRKVEVLKEFSGKERTPTELSERLDLTVSSVNKHLEDLEELELVERCGKKKGKTRSYWKYRLRDFVYFLSSLDGEVERKGVDLDEEMKVPIRALSLPQERFHRPLMKFWYEVQDYIERIDGIMVYGSVARGDAREESDIDVLLVSDDESLEEELGAKVVGKKMFMVKRFTEEEFSEMIEESSDFAGNVLEEGKVIYDPEDILFRWKNEHEG